MSDVTSEILDLQFRIKSVPFADPQSGKKLLYQTFKKRIDNAIAIHKRHHQEKLSGVVLLTKVEPEQSSLAESTLTMLFDPKDPKSREWGINTIMALEHQFQKSCTIHLKPENRFLMPTLEHLGFGAKKVEIIGTVDNALIHLDKLNIIQPETHGFHFTPLKVDQISQVQLMMSHFFLANPHLGVESRRITAEKQARINAREHTRIMESITAGHRSHFTLTHEQKVMGYFGFNPVHNHPIFGNWAGANIVILPPAQGLGISWAAAQYLIKRMKALNIKTMFGVSSNPAVFYVGLRLGMKSRRITLQKEGPFLPTGFIPQMDKLQSRN